MIPEFWQDLAAMRPWRRIAELGGFITVRRDSADPKSELINLPARPERPAQMLKEEWIECDRAVLHEFREAAPIAMSLIDAGLVYDMQGAGLSKMVLESGSESMAKAAGLSSSAASIVEQNDSSGISRFVITHFNFRMPTKESDRAKAAAEAARAVGESVDDQVLSALAAEPNVPTASCFWQAAQILREKGYNGPLRRIGASRTRDFVVQMTHDVIRMVVGLDVTLVQWEREQPPPGCRMPPASLGWTFKVMGIVVPQVRADSNGNVGICRLSSCDAGELRRTMDGKS